MAIRIGSRSTVPAMALLVTLATPVPAQEVPNSPEPFGAVITPQTIGDEVAAEAAERAARNPAAERPPITGVSRWAATVSAARLGDLLIVTAVGWVPTGTDDGDIELAPSRDTTLDLWLRWRGDRQTALVPRPKSFVLDLDAPRWQQFRGRDTLSVLGPDGRQQVVPIKELPKPLPH